MPRSLPLALLLILSPSAAGAAGLELEEATTAQLQELMTSGRYTARRITELYLARIQLFDRGAPGLHAVIELNPDALFIADALDKERKEKGPRGPLHGIPILIKDNIDTGDRMMTTAGSLALMGSIASKDAPVVERLRKAGVIILGKTNLSEWANMRSMHSSSGWSGRGGVVKNPYALDRSACGSSSGTGAAISANFAAAGVGTETDGSIVCPSSMNGIVGIKTTLGLVPTEGVIPIAHSQDTVGPMARTVQDAALLLAAMTDPPGDYTSALKTDALKGARIGVARQVFFGYSEATDRTIERAIADLKTAGAEIVDPADLPNTRQLYDCENEVLLFELKADLGKYLAALGPKAPVHSLAEVIAFNEKEKDKELAFFGQELLVQAQAKGPLTSPAYKKALATCRTGSREQGIDKVMKAKKLDALIAPTTGPAFLIDLITGDHFPGGSSTPAGVSGYPSVTVPAGFERGLPIGISFFGRASSEAKLIGLAYAYEQATKHRRPPELLPTVNPSLP